MDPNNEQNTHQVNVGGHYRDPVSGKELDVVHNAAADALVRLGWERVGDTEGMGTPNPEKTPAMAAQDAAKADKAKKAPEAAKAQDAAKEEGK